MGKAFGAAVGKLQILTTDMQRFEIKQSNDTTLSVATLMTET